MPDIKINYLRPTNKPTVKKGGWFDIPLPYDIYFEANDIVKIVFDLRIQMPEGYEAIIVPRSSTLEKTGLLASGFGVIEDSYCGPEDYIGYRFYATKDGMVSEGSCLVQMRFQEKMKDYNVFSVNDKEFEKNKNRGGFGSTGNIRFNGNVVLDNAFYTGYNDGFCDGYDEGFVKGYDKAIDDLKQKTLGDIT